jgi:hypothetical protein
VSIEPRVTARCASTASLARRRPRAVPHARRARPRGGSSSARGGSRFAASPRHRRRELGTSEDARLSKEQRRFRPASRSGRCSDSSKAQLSGSSPVDHRTTALVEKEQSRTRRPLLVSLYEGGWVVNVVGGSGVGVLGRVMGGERRSSLYCLLGGRTRRHWRPAPRAQVRKGRQAARGKAAPLGAVVGAKDSLLVSMCQIASVSFLATSIWATLAPRCLPSRCLLRW